MATNVNIDRLAQVVSPVRQPAITNQADEWLLSTYGRTFHFAAHFLPPKLRHAVVTLYAFFRTLDDLVDEPAEGQRSEDTQLQLLAWQNWFKAQKPLSAPQEPLGARLAAVLAEYRIPTILFLDFLDGLTSDLEPREIIDFNEMYRYCYRVAGTVGLAMTHVLGVSSPQALAAAESLGIAMQLTNILRDVGGDLAAGRIYLPQEDLERFGSSRAHLLQIYTDGRGPDDRFRALMRFQVARAHRYYAHGMPGIWMLPLNCRLPILIAGRLYRRILTVIEHEDYDVLRSRAATSFPEKMREAAIAFTLDQLWRRGEALPGIEIEAEALIES
jgi:15-cis-phytoene synthase